MPETAILPSPTPVASEDFGRFNAGLIDSEPSPVEDFGRFNAGLQDAPPGDFGKFTDAALAPTPPPPVPSPTPASDTAALDIPVSVPQNVPQRTLEPASSAAMDATPVAPEIIRPVTLSDEPAIFLHKLSTGIDAALAPGHESSPLVSQEVAGVGVRLAGGGARTVANFLEKITGKPYSAAEAGVESALTQGVSDFSRPEGIASLLAFAVPGVADAYAAGVVAKLPEQYGHLKDSIERYGLVSAETARAATEAGIQDLFGFIAAKSAPHAKFKSGKITGEPNAKQIVETAQPDGLRAEPEVPVQINQPAAGQGGERVSAGGQGPPLGAGAQEAPAHLAAMAAELGLRYQGTFGPKGLLQFTGDATNPSTFYVSPEVTADELRAKAAEVKAARVSQPAKGGGEVPKAAAPVDVGAAAAEPVQEVFGFGPGAAAEKEPLRPADPTAKQLADQISGIKTNDPERFSKAVGAVVDKVGATKDAAARAGAAVGNLARGFKRLIWDAPDPTNFDRWKGRWDAALQYNDFQISRLGDALEKAVPNVKRQTAIYNWAAADGDMALLQERADKAPEDVKQGYLDAMALTPEEERVANLQRSAYDEWLERAVENGMLTEGVENYLKRIVTKRPGFENELRAKIGTGKFTTSFREGKRRFWEDMIDAERAGIRYDKRIRGQSLYAQSFEHAVINRTAVRQFFDGETESGRPFAITEGMGIPVEGDAQKSPALLVTPFGARAVRGAKELASQLQTEHPQWSEEKAIAIAKEKILAEYEPLDHPAFKNWQWVHTMEDGTTVLVRGDALVHSSIASKLRNAFVKDRIDWVEPILRAQGFIKGSKLSLSLFHNVHEAINAAGHLTNPANLRPLSDLLEMPEIKMGMEAGLKLVGGANEQAYFAEGMGSHGWPELVPVLGDYVKAFKDATFEDWIPRLKAEAYLRAFERNQKGGLSRLRPTKKLTPEQNAIITARQVNASFGEQNYRQMMRDPRLQQALQGLFLAPDFGESKVRNMGQIFTRYGSEQRMALGVVAAGIYLGARILNQALTGNPQWNKPFTVVAGDKEYTLRSLPGDLAHALFGPHSYLVHRLSPLVQNAVEFLFKRDYRGVPVDWSTMVKDTLLSAIPIPLTYRKGLSWKDQLASALGVTPIPPPKPPKQSRGSAPRPKASGMVKHKDRH